MNPIAREFGDTVISINRLNGSLWLEFKPFSNSFLINSMVVLTFISMRTHGSVEKVTGLRIQEHRDPESQKARDNTYNMLIEHVELQPSFGKHHVDAVVGTTYQHHEWEGLWASRLNFPMTGNGDYFTVLNAGRAIGRIQTASNAMISYLGRCKLRL